MTGNVFTNASAKAKSSMEKAARGKPAAGTDEELKVVNVRMPASLHKRAMMHRLETGESVTALVVRLMKQEFGEK